jgi:anti-sigma factor RsiW
MKPCSKNQQHIVWLALDELDPRQARELRAHFENCEGCRQYWVEISNLAESLAAVEVAPEVQAPGSFHQRVMARLRADESESMWETLVTQLRGSLLNWRVAVSVVALAVILIAALSFHEWHPGVSPSIKPEARIVYPTGVKSDLAPTIANYQTVANQSLEKLDELLTQQASRNPAPTRIYTASDALD